MGFASWQRTARYSCGGHEPNFAALNRGRHLYSAGRPPHWALAHILVSFSFTKQTTVILVLVLVTKIAVNHDAHWANSVMASALGG